MRWLLRPWSDSRGHVGAHATQEEFSITIPDPEADALHSVEDAVRFISTHPMAK